MGGAHGDGDRRRPADRAREEKPEPPPKRETPRAVAQGAILRMDIEMRACHIPAALSSGRKRMRHDRDAQHFLRHDPQALDGVLGRLG
jgi:hypothetical protein